MRSRPGRVAAGEAHLLALIAELDRREAWAGRLLELPAVAAAFAAGRMSWSQVRAVSRVATPDDGVDWPELAHQCSAAQLEKVVRGIRRVQQVEVAAADPPAAAHATRTRYDADGRMVITIYADAQEGAVILAALEAQRAVLDRQRQAEAQAETEAGGRSAPSTTGPARVRPARIRRLRRASKLRPGRLAAFPRERPAAQSRPGRPATFPPARRTAPSRRWSPSVAFPRERRSSWTDSRRAGSRSRAPRWRRSRRRSQPTRGSCAACGPTPTLTTPPTTTRPAARSTGATG